jgi:hypothetical protein
MSLVSIPFRFAGRVSCVISPGLGSVHPLCVLPNAHRLLQSGSPLPPHKTINGTKFPKDPSSHFFILCQIPNIQVNCWTFTLLSTSTDLMDAIRPNRKVFHEQTSEL